MTKRITSLPGAGRSRQWGIALVVAMLTASIPTTMAQSVLRFVESGDDATSAGCRPSGSSESSTLSFTPAASGPSSTTAQQRPASCRLRFVPQTQQTLVEPVAPAAKVAAAASKDKAKLGATIDATASELFPPSQTRPNAFKPRIVATLEHIPAPVPEQLKAHPVRAAREAAPNFTLTLPGTELFTSAAPKTWDLPALDYGKALRQVQPPQAPVVAVKPIEPKRVVARELPPDATEMFTFASPQPIVVQPPVAEQKVAPPASAAPAIADVPPKPVAAPSATTPPRSTLFAASTPKLPPASELDFSRVPAQAEPPKPKFVSAAPSYVATATPIAAPAAPEQLVPASVSQPKLSMSPSAYRSPDGSQVSVTAAPGDPNVYTFRFAGTTNEVPAMLVNDSASMAADSVAGAPPAMLSTSLSMSCDCNDGVGGQYGCPYLPGQSGTRALCGVDCGRYGAPCCSTWSDAQCIPWALFGPGEYVGPARPAHVETYYLRVNDLLTLTFIESRKKSAEHYHIGVGDQLQIEWLQGAGNTEIPLNRQLLVQPDGTVTLPLIGEVMAAGTTVQDFRDKVVQLYSKYQREPQITVTPLTVNVGIQDLLKAVTSKNASSGQTQDVLITPEGTIQAAGIGSVYVQGLTLDELRSELEARYVAAYGPGLTVSPQLTERATSYVFMGGEVVAPGRYTLEGPTTVMQAISMAGGWNNGGNVRQVVVFRRDENWCLKATKIDVRAPLYGNDPCPTNDVWLRENDLVIVPKSRVLCATDLIELYFTRGVYAVFPINYVYDFSQSSNIVPVP